MHRREDLWGPDGQFMFDWFFSSCWLKQSFPCLAALVFDPDRFLDDRLRKYLLPNPFIFLPFNAGPRICLGQQVSPFRSRPVASGVLMRRRFGSSHTMRCPYSSSGYYRRSLALTLLPMRTLIHYLPQAGQPERPGGQSRGCGSRRTLRCMRM